MPSAAAIPGRASPPFRPQASPRPRLVPRRTLAGGRTRTRQALPRGPPPASTGMPPPASVLESRGSTGGTRRGPGGAGDAPAGRLPGPRTHLSFSAGALAALRGASSSAGQGHAPDVSTQGTHGWVPAEVGGPKRKKELRRPGLRPLPRAHAHAHARAASLARSGFLCVPFRVGFYP